MAATDFPSSSSSSSSSSRDFPTWQSEYEAVLLLVKTFGSLFRCVEVGEAAILIRREALEHSLDHHGERQAMEEALNNFEPHQARDAEISGRAPSSTMTKAGLCGPEALGLARQRPARCRISS